MAITTKDLAKICGVSRATITRALYGGSIKEETKVKILEAAEQYGYQPDLLARSLVKGRSMTIGIIVVDLKNQYFPEMINAMENRAKESGYMLNITLHENNKKTELQLIQALESHRVDGLIISPVNKGESFKTMLKQLRMPVVMIGNRIGYDIPSVGIDEVRSGIEATEHILSKGYRNIVFVVPPLKDEEGMKNIGHEQRLEGYEAAMKDAGLKSQVIYGRDYREQALEHMRLAKEKPAYLCSGDLYAGTVMECLSRYQYVPAQDYGIMGYDYLEIFQNWMYRLSTVNNFIEQIGYEAVTLLLKLIEESGPAEDIEIPFRIIEGNTL